MDAVGIMITYFRDIINVLAEKFLTIINQWLDEFDS